MREVFGSMPRCRIALETGMHSPWVSRLLSEVGHEVIVAHARSVRLIHVIVTRHNDVSAGAGCDADVLRAEALPA